MLKPATRERVWFEWLVELEVENKWPETKVLFGTRTNTLNPCFSIFIQANCELFRCNMVKSQQPSELEERARKSLHFF